MSGWIFIVTGVLLISMGSLSVYYGQDLLRRTTISQMPTLNPQQERLLGLIHHYQLQFAASKLIVRRDGALHFDKPSKPAPEINLASELFGNAIQGAVRSREFVALMEGMPPEYLRPLPEMRLDSPFVVTVTEAGIKYLKGRPGGFS